MPRTHKLHRKFDGKTFNWADWAPTKAQAQVIKIKWGDLLGANVRVTKVKHGYYIWVRV